MSYLVLDQARLIIRDQVDDIFTPNVGVRGNDELAEIGLTGQLLDFTTRNGRPDGAAIQHTREGQVIDVLRGARNLGQTVFAQNVRADSRHGGPPPTFPGLADAAMARLT